MSDVAAVFAFRRIASDREGYYHDRWDRAIPVEVTAANQTEALEKARTLSGEPPRGRFWRFALDRIAEVENEDRPTGGNR